MCCRHGVIEASAQAGATTVMRLAAAAIKFSPLLFCVVVELLSGLSEKGTADD